MEYGKTINHLQLTAREKHFTVEVLRQLNRNVLADAIENHGKDKEIPIDIVRSVAEAAKLMAEQGQPGAHRFVRSFEEIDIT